jgi:hypothetical protein
MLLLKFRNFGVPIPIERYIATIETLSCSSASNIFIYIRGNPAKLLKGINPLEAQLLETAVNCHVRFRLGGDSFPPNIYYKIFSKTNVCDINSFAPRDYSSLPRVCIDL